MKIQILNLLQSQNIVSIDELEEKLHLTKRKIRDVLKELRQEEKNIFKIVTVSGHGYSLQILDDDKFKSYMDQQKQYDFNDVGIKDNRILLILFLLLQNTGYISINQISDILDVSRGTIINDLDEVKKHLLQYDLELQTRSHYGVKVIGKENNIRQMLSKISSRLVENQTLSLEFFEFIETLDFKEETNHFVSLLNEYNIIMTNNAIESILFHLKILIYRVIQNNNLNDININEKVIGKTIYKIANEMISFIEEKHHIHITKQEVDLLASQIFGKASLTKFSLEESQEIKQILKTALNKVDQEFATTFAKDEDLAENLLLHILPLTMRVSFGLTLNDSLIGSVSVQYMNAFLVAMRFIDYYQGLHDYELSRDEIGYLALHFATCIEKDNQEKMMKIRRIALLADNMRSSTNLLKARLQSQFPLATILVIPMTSANKHTMDDIELIISTMEVDIPNQKHKVVVIHENLDEKEIRKIKNNILFNEMFSSQKTIELEDLFYEDLFMIKEDGEYLSLIEEMCDVMISKGYAKEGYKESVIERELRFSTIYENGVASPHSLIQMANIDSIGVVILKKPIFYEHKEIQCLFVLNVKKGHLLLHQEISDFIVRFIDSQSKIKSLQFVNNYQKFKVFIKDYL